MTKREYRTTQIFAFFAMQGLACTFAGLMGLIWKLLHPVAGVILMSGGLVVMWTSLIDLGDFLKQVVPNRRKK